MQPDAQNIQNRVNSSTPIRSSSAGANSSSWRGALEGEAALTLEIGGRRWQAFPLRGRARGREALRAEVLVSRGESTVESHFGAVILSSQRDRQRFVGAAAAELDADPQVLHRELKQLVAPLLVRREAQLGTRDRPHPAGEAPASELDPAECAAADALLVDPRALTRLEAGLALNGLTGPIATLAYLSCMSRLTEEPLALLVPADGEERVRLLPDRILAFFPEELIFGCDQLTRQVLASVEEHALQHGILSVSEYKTSAAVRHAIQCILERRKYRAATLEPDPETKRRRSQQHLVRGPVAVIMQTPEVEGYEKFAAPCVALPPQAPRDPAPNPQREGAEWDAQLDAAGWRRISRHLQRQLEPLVVDDPAVVPELPASVPPRLRKRYRRARRAVARTISVFHQKQREIYTRWKDGKLVRCVRATSDDFLAADRLLLAVWPEAAYELPQRTAELLAQLLEMVQQLAKARRDKGSPVYFDRNRVHEWLGASWGSATQLYERIRVLHHLGYLTLREGRPGRRFLYQLDRARCAAALAGRFPSSPRAPVNPVPDPAEPGPEGLEASPTPTAPAGERTAVAAAAPATEGAAANLSTPQSALSPLTGSFQDTERTVNPPEYLEKSRNGASDLHIGSSRRCANMRGGTNGGGSASAPSPPCPPATAQTRATPAPPQPVAPAPDAPPPRARSRPTPAPNRLSGRPALPAPNPPDATGAPLRGAPARGPRQEPLPLPRRTVPMTDRSRSTHRQISNSVGAARRPQLLNPQNGENPMNTTRRTRMHNSNRKPTRSPSRQPSRPQTTPPLWLRMLRKPLHVTMIALLLMPPPQALAAIAPGGGGGSRERADLAPPAELRGGTEASAAEGAAEGTPGTAPRWARRRQARASTPTSRR